MYSGGCQHGNFVFESVACTRVNVRDFATKCTDNLCRSWDDRVQEKPSWRTYRRFKDITFETEQYLTMDLGRKESHMWPNSVWLSSHLGLKLADVEVRTFMKEYVQCVIQGKQRMNAYVVFMPSV